ncbi:thiamine biosynthesis protein ThiF (plasmid) [Rossellomorea sp. AcN35-11]|nr:thiamine biosynthesis protein ThiF [Rossellomorea aquimaris]WJV32376.1 thiamine biosynthesis protein ThiF [Rossellomorea sp. AcN35-11]
MSNQLFDHEDIGDYKVTALAERYGHHYGLEVKEVQDYITNQDTLHRLYTPLTVNEEVQVLPVLISMVDNNATRKIFDEFFYSDYLPDLVYLDAGVEGVSLDNSLSTQEKECTGFSGQVCTGLKMSGEVWLEPVMRVYPDMWEDEDHLPEQSCGEAIVNNPQRCQTNKMAATLANGVMNNLLHNNTIYVHHVDFNAQFGGSRPTFIKSKLIREYNSTVLKAEQNNR